MQLLHDVLPALYRLLRRYWLRHILEKKYNTVKPDSALHYHTPTPETVLMLELTSPLAAAIVLTTP